MDAGSPGALEAPEQTAGPVAETPTGQSRLAYRLAAGLLFAGTGLAVIDGVVAWSMPSLTPIAIDVAIAIGLLQFRRGARTWTLVRSVLGMILWPLLWFTSTGPSAASLLSLPQWGYSLAMILLLTGRSKTWRLCLAAGLFVVLTLGFAVYGLIVTAGRGTGVVTGGSGSLADAFFALVIVAIAASILARGSKLGWIVIPAGVAAVLVGLVLCAQCVRYGLGS
jgi:hypothetical protein